MTLSNLHFYSGHCVDSEEGWGGTVGIKNKKGNQ